MFVFSTQFSPELIEHKRSQKKYIREFLFLYPTEINYYLGNLNAIFSKDNFDTKENYQIPFQLVTKF